MKAHFVVIEILSYGPMHWQCCYYSSHCRMGVLSGRWAWKRHFWGVAELHSCTAVSQFYKDKFQWGSTVLQGLVLRSTMVLHFDKG